MEKKYFAVLTIALGFSMALFGIPGLEKTPFLGSIELDETQLTPEKISHSGEVESIIKKIISSDGVIDLEKIKEQGIEIGSSGSIKTPTFSVGPGEWMTEFYVKLNDFPADEITYYRISFFEVGNRIPLNVYEDKIVLRELKQKEWQAGEIAGGIKGMLFNGPSKFYYKIEVYEIDEWILKIGEAIG